MKYEKAKEILNNIPIKKAIRVYTLHYKKREQLLHKLFDEVAVETLGTKKAKAKIDLRIIQTSSPCYCEIQLSGKIIIGLALGNIKERVEKGYTDCYYTGRADKLNKYILYNKHNEVRFIFYHELRHAKQEIDGLLKNASEAEIERDADDWALAHLERRR